MNPLNLELQLAGNFCCFMQVNNRRPKILVTRRDFTTCWRAEDIVPNGGGSLWDVLGTQLQTVYTLL